MNSATPRVNAIVLPFGDQLGLVSTAGLLVSCTGLVPSAFITQISKSPSRLLSNAIFVPSGDQAGPLS